MIKMFGWEERIKLRVATKREAELTLIWRRRLMSLCVDCTGKKIPLITFRATVLMNTFLPVLTMAVTFACYTAVQKRELTAAKGTLGTFFFSRSSR